MEGEGEGEEEEGEGDTWPHQQGEALEATRRSEMFLGRTINHCKEVSLILMSSLLKMLYVLIRSSFS